MSKTDPPVRDGTGRASVQIPEVLDVDQTFDADGLHALRSTVAAHASSLGVAGWHVEMVVILASELATNAIRHGGGGGRIRMWHSDDAIYCQVSDGGPGIEDESAGTALPRYDQPDGRGLWICRAIAHDVMIERGATGRGAVVTAVLRRDALDGP